MKIDLNYIAGEYATQILKEYGLSLDEIDCVVIIDKKRFCEKLTDTLKENSTDD